MQWDDEYICSILNHTKSWSRTIAQTIFIDATAAAAAAIGSMDFAVEILYRSEYYVYWAFK